jgi:hypothetical protein
MKVSEAPHINNTSSPLVVFMLFFVEVIGLLVVETSVLSPVLKTPLFKAHHIFLMYANLKCFCFLE